MAKCYLQISLPPDINCRDSNSKREVRLSLPVVGFHKDSWWATVGKQKAGLGRPLARLNRAFRTFLCSGSSTRTPKRSNFLKTYLMKCCEISSIKDLMQKSSFPKASCQCFIAFSPRHTKGNNLDLPCAFL